MDEWQGDLWKAILPIHFEKTAIQNANMQILWLNFDTFVQDFPGVESYQVYLENSQWANFQLTSLIHWNLQAFPSRVRLIVQMCSCGTIT